MVDVKANKIQQIDKPIHNWYRFATGYTPHLVRNLFEKLDVEGKTIIDPFCGSGTTIIEAMLNGYDSFGVDANPAMVYLSNAKTILVNPDLLDGYKNQIIELSNSYFDNKNIDELISLYSPFLIKNTFNHNIFKTILSIKLSFKSIENTILIPLYNTVLVNTAINFSNLRFCPEPSYSAAKSKKVVTKKDIYRFFLFQIQIIQRDMKLTSDRRNVMCRAIHANSLDFDVECYRGDSVIISSPPYPTEKDYTKLTRIELVLLDFIKSIDDLQLIKKDMVRSSTKNCYKDDNDFQNINTENLHNLYKEIKEKGVEKKKVNDGLSGFESKYHTVVGEYFGGMIRHLINVHKKVKGGTKIAYVLGDQASYFNTLIRTADLLGEAAEATGLYRVEEIYKYRSRASTKNKSAVDENVLIMEAI